MSKPTRAHKLAKAERLKRFMEAVAAGKEPDLTDKLTGLAVIMEAKRKLKGGRRPRKRYYMDSEQFGVGVLLALGEIDRQEALKMLCELCACETRTAEKHLADILPRARKLAPSFKKAAS